MCAACALLVLCCACWLTGTAPAAHIGHIALPLAPSLRVGKCPRAPRNSLSNAVLCPLLLATRFSIIIVAIPAAPYHTWRPTTALLRYPSFAPAPAHNNHVFTGGPYDLVRHAGPPEPRNVACRVKRSLSKLQCITTIKRMRLRVVSCSEFGASERAPVQAERSSWAGSQWAGSS